MKSKLSLLLASLGVAAFTTAAYADIAYDGFDYATGSITGQGSAADDGWGGSWVNSGTVASGSLGGTTDATLATTGNSLSVAVGNRVGRALDTSYSDASSQEIWMSFIFGVTDVRFGYQAFELSGTAGGAPSDADRVFQLGIVSGDRTDFSMRANNDGATDVSLGAFSATPDTSAQPATGPNFFVLRFDLVNGGDDTIDVWLNPTVADLSGPATASITTASLGAFSAVDVAAFGFGDSNIDEFRIGTTVEAVAVPEPSAYGFIAGALALGLVAVRRRA